MPHPLGRPRHCIAILISAQKYIVLLSNVSSFIFKKVYLNRYGNLEKNGCDNYVLCMIVMESPASSCPCLVLLSLFYQPLLFFPHFYNPLRLISPLLSRPHAVAYTTLIIPPLRIGVLATVRLYGIHSTRLWNLKLLNSLWFPRK